MLERIKQWFAPKASADSTLTFEQLQQWITGGVSDAGVVVNEKSAASVSAVYACVGLIGGAIASLPLHLYRDGPTREKLAKDGLWYTLNEQWTDGWSASTAWQYIAWSRLLHGDGFARILRRGKSPEIMGLRPWHPLCVTPIPLDGGYVYRLQDPVTKSVETVHQDDVLHFPMPWFDEACGRSLSPLSHALRNPAGIAIAADEFSASFFKNGARPDFLLKAVGATKLSQTQVDQFREQWEQRYGNRATNSHRPAIMQNMEVEQLTMSAEDSQLIETRQFQTEDIARIFRVPPHMIGHTDKTTSWGTGIEQMSIGFVTYTLQPHLTAIEQEINRKFFRRAGKFSEFSVDGLLRGDSKTRSDAYKAAVGGSSGPGWMTRNEIRRLENLPPIDGGDELTDWKPNAQPPSTAGQ